MTKPAKKASTLRIGYRYRPNRIDDHYDCIVIGSGPSGLSTAACLSKMGQKVAVLEQHYTAGGFTHAYIRNGYEWDVGVHFMNDVAVPGSLPRKLFDFISDSKLEWRAMDEEKVLLNIGDAPQVVLTLKAEKDKERLKQIFPDEADAIDRIYAHSQKTVNRAMPLILMMRLCGRGFIGRSLASLFARLIPNDIACSAYDVLSRFTTNQTLLRTICSVWVAAGITPDRLSYLMVAGTHVNQNPMGFPMGGSSEIAKNIIPVIQQSGGDVFTYAKVKDVLVENGLVMGVRMQDDHIIRADNVVSTAGVFNTFTHLLPEDVVKRYGYDQKLEQVNRTVGHFNLFVGFNDSNENLGLKDSEHFVFNSFNYEEDVAAFEKDLKADIPFLYVTFASAKDGSWSERYPDRSTASIFFYIENFEHFSRWRNQQWEKRGEEYDAMKADMSERVLEILFKHYPHLRDHLDYFELSTPLSTRYFCIYEKGEIYGLNHDANRMRQSWLRPSTLVPGFYLAGQDSLIMGHTTAAMSGVLAAWNLLGMRQGMSLWKKINA